MKAGFQDFLCGNLGAFQLCRELGGKAHGSFGLNITNAAGLEAFARLGLLSAEVSPELSGREISAAQGGRNLRQAGPDAHPQLPPGQCPGVPGL